jgi:hypothetical protein
VSPEGITTDPEKLEAVREWPTPRNKHEVRSFVGLCIYYRRFISGFADIAKPLTRLTEEKQAFQWTPEVETAFQTLKEALCTAPSLRLLVPSSLILFSQLSLRLPSGLFLSGISYELIHAFLIYPYAFYMPNSSHTP